MAAPDLPPPSFSSNGGLRLPGAINRPRRIPLAG